MKREYQKFIIFLVISFIVLFCFYNLYQQTVSQIESIETETQPEDHFEYWVVLTSPTGFSGFENRSNVYLSLDSMTSGKVTIAYTFSNYSKVSKSIFFANTYSSFIRFYLVLNGERIPLNGTEREYYAWHNFSIELPQYNQENQPGRLEIEQFFYQNFESTARTFVLWFWCWTTPETEINYAVNLFVPWELQLKELPYSDPLYTEIHFYEETGVSTFFSAKFVQIQYKLMFSENYKASKRYLLATSFTIISIFIAIVLFILDITLRCSEGLINYLDYICRKLFDRSIANQPTT